MTGKNRFEFFCLPAIVIVMLAVAATPRPLECQNSHALTTIREVRALTPDQASEARPVHLKGIVIVLSGWKTSFFFQDSTSGISVYRLNDSPPLQPASDMIVTNDGFSTTPYDSVLVQLKGRLIEEFPCANDRALPARRSRQSRSPVVRSPSRSVACFRVCAAPTASAA